VSSGLIDIAICQAPMSRPRWVFCLDDSASALH
jgi:hypothetical protein